MIVGKSLDELAELKTEIEQNLASDRSFALELQYWSNILKKIDEQIANEAQDAQPTMDAMGNPIDPATGQPLAPPAQQGAPQVGPNGQPIDPATGQELPPPPPPKFEIRGNEMEAA